METYDTKTASRIVGVSLRQLQYWDEQNFIRPSVKMAEGRGTKRLYSFFDLVCLKVAKDLTGYGLNLQKIRRCLKPLKNESCGTVSAAASLRYLTDGEELFVITEDRQKMLDVMDRQFVLSLGIGSLVCDLNARARSAAAVVHRKSARKPRRLNEHDAGSA